MRQPKQEQSQEGRVLVEAVPTVPSVDSLCRFSVLSRPGCVLCIGAKPLVSGRGGGRGKRQRENAVAVVRGKSHREHIEKLEYFLVGYPH